METLLILGVISGGHITIFLVLIVGLYLFIKYLNKGIKK